MIGTLLERKLITTAGRKAVVGRPMLYKTTKDFLLRFGLKDVSELPSWKSLKNWPRVRCRTNYLQETTAPWPMPPEYPTITLARKQHLRKNPPVKHAHINQNEDGGVEQLAEDKAERPQNVTEPTVFSDPKHNRTDEQVADQIASESTGG